MKTRPLKPQRSRVCSKKGKETGTLTFSEITEALSTFDMDKDVIENTYETLSQLGIEVVDEDSKDDHLDLIEDIDYEKESVIAEEVKAEALDLSAPKGVSIDDPVRMYLKEIGKKYHFSHLKKGLNLPGEWMKAMKQ